MRRFLSGKLEEEKGNLYATMREHILGDISVTNLNAFLEFFSSYSYIKGVVQQNCFGLYNQFDTKIEAKY